MQACFNYICKVQALVFQFHIFYALFQTFEQRSCSIIIVCISQKACVQANVFLVQIIYAVKTEHLLHGLESNYVVNYDYRVSTQYILYNNLLRSQDSTVSTFSRIYCLFPFKTVYSFIILQNLEKVRVIRSYSLLRFVFQ